MVLLVLFMKRAVTLAGVVPPPVTSWVLCMMVSVDPVDDWIGTPWRGTLPNPTLLKSMEAPEPV